MLGWVITCHDDRAQEILDALEKKHGALLQCRAVNFWRGLSSNMLSRMMCDALHETDSGEGAIFLTDIAGAPPYRVASLLSHKHSRCEVISGVTLPLIEQMMACCETMTSSAFREHIVELGAPEVSSLWHQQQKNPPFVLKHNLYEY
ncbi:PTS sugar transporter subunit IIA [Escherichia coli]|uniref:PTS sugar transporter subunit IIA n=1 Tax=Escherichia coli TaxID=562 RepID=UPI000BDF9410|nr:PTS sugar transporter subunit IIA [Escherichia coli]